MKKRLGINSKYFKWGLTAFLVVAASVTFYLLVAQWTSAMAVISRIIAIFSPIIYGLIFAYLLNKLMMLFEKAFLKRLGNRMYPNNAKKARRATRIMAVLLTMICAVIIVGGALALIIPQLILSIENIVAAMPGYLQTAIDWLNRFLHANPALESWAVKLVGNVSDSLTNWIQTAILGRADTIIANVTSGVVSVLRGFANILLGFVLAIYLLYRKELFCAQTKKILYALFKVPRANRLLRWTHFVDRTCGGFLTGKIIDSIIVGIITYILMIIFNIPYAVLVSVIVGIANIIPFLGPYIGAIIGGLIILLESPEKCLIFIIFTIILQQIDGNVIYPKIGGNTIGLSGFWIIFAILVGGGIFGFPGFIFGVPVFAVLYAIVKNFAGRKLVKRELPVGTAEYEEIARFDPETSRAILKSELPPEQAGILNRGIVKLIRRTRGGKSAPGGSRGEVGGDDKKDDKEDN